MEGYSTKPTDMSLDLAKLEMIRDKGEAKVARCPACAEAGRDRRGGHLWVGADGRFGCIANPGDRDHARRIWALVGVQTGPIPDKRRRRLVIREPQSRTLRTPKRLPISINLPPHFHWSEKTPSRTSENEAKRCLVPRDAPWREDGRYLMAVEKDGGRLDLFIEAENGPWLRRHGTIVLVGNPSPEGSLYQLTDCHQRNDPENGVSSRLQPLALPVLSRSQERLAERP